MKAALLLSAFVFIPALTSCAHCPKPAPPIRFLPVAPRPLYLVDPSDRELWNQLSGQICREQADRSHQSYTPGTLDTAYDLPLCDERPWECRILQGEVIESGVPESERADLRVVVFRQEGHGPKTIVEECASPRAMEVWDFGRPGTLFVFMHGPNKRGGTQLSILAWNIADGSLDDVISMGGEEEADCLAYHVETGDMPELQILGIRPEKHSEYERRLPSLSDSLGLTVKLR